MPTRARAWLPDELILALDLYFQKGPNPGADAAQELSEVLRSIPIEPEQAEDPKFRSPQSVTYKLQNFVAVDPSRPTQGFSHGGRLDEEIFKRFSEDPNELHEVAMAIRANLGSISPEEAEENEESVEDAKEGRLLTRIHRKRERSTKLRRAKKKRVEKETGRLACEACDLDFGESYGARGKGFIECHHIVPLHTLKPNQRTKLDDLALLCPNCHRVLHMRKPWLTVEAVRGLVERHDDAASKVRE
ncbi:MAG TPA: HNH endonuclease [Solirubrobacterales bacterium]|nr:HNH endonuclease [Solirubrobacterales bacterium]